MEPEVKRAPLFSTTELLALTPADEAAYECAEHVRDYYEDLIDRGELMVVKTVKMRTIKEKFGLYGSRERLDTTCPNCSRDVDQDGVMDNEIPNFCPWCGAKIIE